MDIKSKTVKWKVSNFSPGRTFDTVRCIKDRLGGFLSEDINRRGMVSSRRSAVINILELRAEKFATLTFCRYKKGLAVHVQMGNEAALAYLVKMGRTRNLLMIQEAKEIWEFCLGNCWGF